MGLNREDTKAIALAAMDTLEERLAGGVIEVMLIEGCTPERLANEIRAASQKLTRRYEQMQAAVNQIQRGEFANE